MLIKIYKVLCDVFIMSIRVLCVMTCMAALLTKQIVILIVLSILEKNRKGKRPGIVEPLNFLQDDNHSLIYGAAFGCTAYEIVSTINDMGSSVNVYNISRFVKPWIKILIWLLIALLSSLRIYPVFATIKGSRLLVDPLIGFFYTAYLTIVFSYQLYMILSVRGLEAIVVAYIPTLVCYAVLLAYFFYKIITHIITLIRSDQLYLNQATRKCASMYQTTYVKWLLRKPEKRFKSSENSVKRSLESYTYDVKLKLGLTSPLRTSPRVIVTFIVTAIALFEIGAVSTVTYTILSHTLSTTYHQLIPVASNLTFTGYVTTFIIVMDVGFYISFSISSMFMAVYICTLFLSYRKDLESMHRGDYSFLSMKLKKTLNDNLIASSLRYAGMQIAYLVWCYILCTFVGWILCLLVAYIVILPLTGDVPMLFFEPVPLLLPAFIINFLFRKGQVLLARTFFLQDFEVAIPWKTETQRVLALDNIKTFNILTFFMFFFHAIIGFISCISRITIGLAIGLVSLARIDKCMLPRGFEKWDKGYSTYVGMIMVELYHRNPILCVFCDQLLSINDNQGCTSVLLEPVVSTKEQETNNQKHKRICRRWQKAYTLLRNPCIRRTTSGNIECSIEQIQVHVKC